MSRVSSPRQIFSCSSPISTLLGNQSNWVPRVPRALPVARIYGARKFRATHQSKNNCKKGLDLYMVYVVYSGYDVTSVHYVFG